MKSYLKDLKIVEGSKYLMEKRHEYHKKSGNNQGRPYHKAKRNSIGTGAAKDNAPAKNNNRDNAPKQNYSRRGSSQRGPSPRGSSSRGSFPKYNEKIRPADETYEDIKADISRIEKEIQLELKEIRSLKL
jgi:hypothetical protein